MGIHGDFGASCWIGDAAGSVRVFYARRCDRAPGVPVLDGELCVATHLCAMAGHGGSLRRIYWDWLFFADDMERGSCVSASGRCRFSICDWHCGHRSEEHTSELQSRFDLVCRLLLEKKK